MNLSPVKQEILEALLLHCEPVKAAQLAKELKKEFPPVMMHILGLIRMGCVLSPEKGLYVISEDGKKTLGLPTLNKETALRLLEKPPLEKAFYFYSDVGKPLNLCANSLLDFCKKVTAISSVSIEFHMNRGDFKAWFDSLGDGELAKKTSLLQQKELKGEELKIKFLVITKTRCIELSNLVNASAT